MELWLRQPGSRACVSVALTLAALCSAPAGADSYVFQYEIGLSGTRPSSRYYIMWQSGPEFPAAGTVSGRELIRIPVYSSDRGVHALGGRNEKASSPIRQRPERQPGTHLFGARRPPANFGRFERGARDEHWLTQTTIRAPALPGTRGLRHLTNSSCPGSRSITWPLPVDNGPPTNTQSAANALGYYSMPLTGSMRCDRTPLASRLTVEPLDR